MAYNNNKNYVFFSLHDDKVEEIIAFSNYKNSTVELKKSCECASAMVYLRIKNKIIAT